MELWEDKPKEACGVFGVYGHPEASHLTYLGLYALQHRGEESAGIVSTDKKQMYAHRGMGLVADVFTEENLSQLKGPVAIGHTRYSTTGSSLLKNAQPLLVDTSRGPVAVGHNGNLVNASVLRDELEAHGSLFQTTIDSEIILHLMARPKYRTQEEGLLDTLRQLKGAFTLVFLTDREVIGVRDPNGFRPLCLGKLNGAYILASETCALDMIGAQFVREIEPGEVVFIDDKGPRFVKPFAPQEIRPTYCIFEHVYFARPDSTIFGENVHQVRQKLGRQLAREHPAEADVVIPVPDSGNSAALGYSLESGIPFEFGITRNHYVGRTFIQPTQSIRDFKVKVKFNPMRQVLEGKRVVLVDDSIIRGTTSKTRVKSLFEAGAKEVHLRVSCPPSKNPCFYGIDFPTPKELIANNHTIEETRKYLGLTSLGYLSLEGLLSAVKGQKDHYCTACFSGNYPVDFGKEGNKYLFEKNSCG